MSANDSDTVDTMDTLTPEERAAIGGDEYGDEDREIIKKIAGEASDEDADEDDDDDDGDDEDVGDAGSQPQEGKAAEPPQDGQTTDAEPQTVDPVKAVAQYQADLPEDFDQKFSDLKARDAELRQRFKDGDIDIDERDAGLAEIAAEREQLLIQKAAAETLAKINEQNQRQAAADYERRFVERVKADGIDYTQQRNINLFNTLLAELQEEHGDKGRDWLWNEAHKAVLRARGVPLSRAASQDPVADAKAKRKPPVDAAPTTLAQVPGSDGPGDVSDEFSDVLALDGLEFEEAIARMSPAQREKFLRGR